MADATRSEQALVAGGGALPGQVIAARARSGAPLTVIALEPFAETEVVARADAVVALGALGRCLDALRERSVREVAFVGTVHRPDYSALKLDAVGLQYQSRFIDAAQRGDSALLDAYLDVFRSEGFAVVGVQRLEPSLAVGSGHLAGPPLRDQDHRDMAVASAAAAAIGAIDAGQGAIVADGLVLALEAQEGTDAMLGRIPSLSPVVRGAPGDRRGVLVKRPKSRQDRRVDLPVIGPRTIDLAHQAGLAGVAVETGGALVVDRPQTLERCRDRAVFLFGFAPDGP